MNLNVTFHLEHEQNSVHEDEQHDEVFEGLRRHQPPDVVPDSGRLRRHVQLHRLGLDGEIDARFLKEKHQVVNDNIFGILQCLSMSALKFESKTWFLKI